MSSDLIKTLILVIGFIAGGITWAVTNFPNKDDVKAVVVTEIMSAEHVPVSEFKEYIDQQAEADEQRYILDLKEDIRDIRMALRLHPDDEYLQESLDELMWELCDLRPDDKLCEETP